jgi:membrane protein YdbS with pleckstrin-like domain
MNINYKLKDQLPDEVVIKVVRRDSMILFKKLVSFMVFVAAITGGVFLVLNIFPGIVESSLYPVVLLFGFAFIFYSWLFFFLLLTDYILDVWFITSKRIVDIQQDGFFSRRVAEQYLSRVQDVKSEMVGVLPTLFKYGNVRVQTAGEQEHFVFEDVSDPEMVRRLIMELIEKSQEPSISNPNTINQNVAKAVE